MNRDQNIKLDRALSKLDFFTHNISIICCDKRKILSHGSSIYCRPAGRDYSKKKGYFRDEGEGPNFQATPAGQVEDSSAESAPCM